MATSSNSSMRIAGGALLFAASTALAAPLAPMAAARDALERSLKAKCPPCTFEVREDADAATERDLAAAPQWTVKSTDTALRRRMTVLLEPVGTAAVRAARVGFTVEAHANAWKLLHAADPGVPLRAEDVQAVTADAIAEPDLAAVPDVALWRPTRPLPEGRVLRLSDLAAADSVLRGDLVDVRLQAGAVALEARGTALNAGKPGELVKVALPGRRDTVEGTVTADRRILVRP
ncbi:flagellar basal body P-ring formation chaperone FlgA [Piscinibacter terrae]|uniref:Flagella basal body P-ring formation protein FlgA n=1 Tax=Piscinibacter terrae TaxID=2496871 RepID=A0A3N7HYZ7_9BURK|nr:flagellar basal body P-ring formation chaperone FlgA [Albitalea terrae]RQP26656.1 flagella basal body P-ring formation protein FlgA [Albitalea terrae]